MTRLPTQPPDNLYQAATSILEHEVPAGGLRSMVTLVFAIPASGFEPGVEWFCVARFAEIRQ
jgi:hypothetical protein